MKNIFREYVKTASGQQLLVVCRFGTIADVLKAPAKAKEELL